MTTPPMASRARNQVTPAISATAAELRPSRAAAVTARLRSLAISGSRRAVITKAGRKIATVATTAPGTPRSRYPMKVAVVNSGPGVIWPMATASRICPSVSHP